MGLDISLIHCNNVALVDAEEELLNHTLDALYEAMPPYAGRTAEEKLALSVALQKAEAVHKARLDEAGVFEVSVYQDSKIAPEHLYKIGYFRSSYNEGGINSHMFDRGLPDLHSIFETDCEDGYRVAVNWEASLIAIDDAIRLYEQYLTTPMADYTASKMYNFGSNSADQPMVYGRKDALDKFSVFLKEQEEKAAKGHVQRVGNYSNKDGEWFPTGLVIYAILWSQNGVTYIYKQSSEEREEGKEDWYLTAWRIVRETAEYVLAQPDPENYYLGWSS